ncbi:Arc family DNA-binding protein [Streptomyces mirabilis]|uniref:Arc family DNA-binding protein n=1 Tax=Streptomyces mirabilis TaxID=68239 RepID=UPI0036AECB9D
MDNEVRITLRLPADLHARLVAQAKAGRRSLNSEIVYRLETEPRDLQPGPGPDKS